MNSSALLAYDNDILTRTAGEWMAAHTSFMQPVHRYEGEIAILQDCLLFKGIDKRTGENDEIIIPRYSISQVYHGLDDIYSAGETRGMGLTWKPIRLTIDDDRYIYLIINYRLGFTSNKEWFQYLVEWLQ